MTARSIAIVGGGIAGLATGCYAQMSGYQTRIFEAHSLPGGVCTAWQRQGYTFDGCLQWLVGTRPGGSLSHLWQELAVLPGLTIVNHDEFVRIEGEDGQTLILYADADRLVTHLRALSPDDAGVIDELGHAVRQFARFHPPLDKPRELMSRVDMASSLLKLLPFARTFRTWQQVTVPAFAARFRDPFLRAAFGQIFPSDDFPMLFMLVTLAWQHDRNAGYPIGGSLPFARALERQYVRLGGEVQYHARVERVLVEHDRAVGVRLADGTEHRADVVVSAADGHATIFDLLGGQYVDDEIRGYYERLPIFRPLVQVSLGVARDLAAEPHALSLALTPPMTVAGAPVGRLQVRHYGYDPTLAPAGKSVVIALIDTDYDAWRAVAADPARYAAEKERVAGEVIARLDQRWPGLGGQVEVVDVATPLTWERITGNWRGAYEGWQPTMATMALMFGKGMRKTLPGLDGFFMAGQWVEPGGGVPTAAMSGRAAVQLICARDKRPFVATAPVTANRQR